MHLSLSPDLAKALLNAADPKLTETLAGDLLAQIDPLAMARYLLTPDVAAALLTERLRTAPGATLRDLETLPPRNGTPTRARRAKSPPAKKQRVAGKAKIRSKKRKGGRLRLSADEIALLKEIVRSYLQRHGWATRKEISEAAQIPTPSIYNRVMGELVKAREVVAKGDKATRVYALKGTKAKQGPSKAKTAPKAKTASKKAKVKKPQRKPLLCPVPGCKNKAAPVFGMMCREHKDLPKAKRDKLFAARRKGW